MDTESEFHLIAEGRSSKSGNLHIQGEWERAPPKPGTVGASYIYGPAYGFTLDNLGGYVAHIKVQWSTDNGATWHTTSNQSKDVSLWEIYDQNIEDLDPNIPIGSWVRMKMDVVWGDDVVAAQIFKYLSIHRDCAGPIINVMGQFGTHLWGSPTLTVIYLQMIFGVSFPTVVISLTDA